MGSVKRLYPEKARREVHTPKYAEDAEDLAEKFASTLEGGIRTTAL
jgi:hypothetical protein